MWLSKNYLGYVVEKRKDEGIELSKMGLCFIAGVEYKGAIYASAKEINGLFRLDLATQEVTYIKRFNKEKNEWAIYREAFLYNNEAWFIPGKGEYIAIVNLDTFEIEYFRIPFKRIDQEAILQGNGAYSSVYSSGDVFAHKFLYLIPANIDALLLIDMETKELYPYYEVARTKEFFKNGVYINQNIYLYSKRENSLIKLNLRTKEKNQCPLPRENGLYEGMIYYKNKLWLISSDGDHFFVIDLETQKGERVLIKRSCDKRLTYHDFFIRKNELFLLPCSGNKILKYDLETGGIMHIDIDHGWIQSGGVRLKRIWSLNKIILVCMINKIILIYDEIKKDFQKISLDIERSLLLQTLQEKKVSLNMEGFKINGYYIEGILGIEDLMTRIVGQYIQEKGYRNVGENIYFAVKGEV